jgi:hypothetical protein
MRRLTVYDDPEQLADAVADLILVQLRARRGRILLARGSTARAAYQLIFAASPASRRSSTSPSSPSAATAMSLRSTRAPRSWRTPTGCTFRRAAGPG